MKSVVTFLHSGYHRLAPYDLRVKLWAARRRVVVNADRRPRPEASAAERYAVRLIGNTALKNSAFAQTVVARSASSGSEHTMLKTWIEYALGTNERGNSAVHSLQQHIEVVGARQLDIGCAYGGTSIAFASAGAEAYGVEIDPGLLELAKTNLADHPGVQCRLLCGDILQPELANSMGQFDIITCDNVIEHVEKASQLVSTIAHLLKPSGVCQLAIPNAFAYQQVMRDGHYGLFGLTLFERDRAITYYHAAGNTEAYSVGEYCFTYDDYEKMFANAGLRLTLLNPLPYRKAGVASLRQQITKMRDVFEKQVTGHTIPIEFQDEIRANLGQYLSQFSARYAEYQAANNAGKSASSGGRLLNDYQQEQWQVLVRHTHANG
jgi:2-polyprenyl-3-methyl-5-hydroxy-6-metoxy-1,4-benzoquinol methylase